MQQDQFGSFEESQGSYRQSFTRRSPGLLVFLLDQSSSMQEYAQLSGYLLTLAQLAASIINHLFLSLISNTPFDLQTGHRKNYCDVTLFGYGDTVVPLLSPTGIPVSISDLAEHPVGTTRVHVSKYDRLEKKYIEVVEEQPYWIGPHAASSQTDMAMAVNVAYNVVSNWLMADPQRRRSFPPIVFNITDGCILGPAIQFKRQIG